VLNEGKRRISIRRLMEFGLIVYKLMAKEKPVELGYKGDGEKYCSRQKILNGKRMCTPNYIFR
jgi:hypothetical protein